MKNLLASIIISVSKDNRIYRCLDSLSTQTISRDQYEIIVIENGSHDLECLHSLYSIVYAYCPEANMALARNIGLGLSQSDIVLFTDADCVVENSWIEEIVNYLKKSENNLAGVGGIIERYKPLTPVERYGSNLVENQKGLSFLPILDLPYIATANAAFKKDVLIKVDGFDNTLLSGNDVDICYKIGILGYKLDICDTAIIYHENRKTVLGHYKRFFRYAVYQVLLFKKYRNIHKKKFFINIYPYKCLKKSIKLLPKALNEILKKNPSLLWTSYLLIIEAVGVLLGDIYGSYKFKIIYI